MKNGYSIKNSFWTLLALCHSLWLVGCSDEEGIDVSKESSRPQMELYGEVNQVYVTRVNDAGFGDGDAIGVFVVNYENGEPATLKASGNYADNVRFTYSETSGKWTGSYTLYWKDQQTPADIYGYYPFDAELADVTVYRHTIPANQQKEIPEKGVIGYEAGDFLWAKTTGATPSGGTVNLTHNHLMAGIEVKVMEGMGFADGEWEKLEKNVLVEQVHLQTTIDFATGSVSLVEESKPASVIPAQKSDSWRAVVAPQTLDAGTNLLSITIDGTTYRHSRPDEPTTYWGGKLHKFTITVSKRLPEGDYEFTILQEAVTAWENDEFSHASTVREYLTVHVEKPGSLKQVVENEMQLDPKGIVNLRLTGTMNQDDFWWLHDNMVNLEAINMKDLRSVDCEVAGYNMDYEELRDSFPEYYRTREDDAIPRFSFYEMNALKYVIFPDSMKFLGENSFALTVLNGSLHLPDGLRFIGGNAFGQSSYIGLGHEESGSFTGKLEIPQSVEFIGEYAFESCNFTGELHLPPTMKYIGNSAFRKCKYLSGHLVIPDGLKELHGCWDGTNMTDYVKVPQGVRSVSISETAITGIVLPEGVERVILSDNPNLKGELHLPSTIKRLLVSGDGITHVNLPEGIEEVGFYETTTLQDTIVLPSTVVSTVFQDCYQLAAVVLPAGVSSVSLLHCYALEYIQCLGSTPLMLNKEGTLDGKGIVFVGVNKETTQLVVPKGAVEAYRNAEGWNEFKRITEYRDFVCRPMVEKRLNKGRTRNLILNADGEWEVTHCPSWARPSAMSGYKKTEMTVTMDDLAHGVGNRRDSIVFTLTGQTDELGRPITCCMQLYQYDYEHEEDGELLLQQATQGKGVNICLVGDGYDAQDIGEGEYMEDMQQVVEYFFDVEPYKTYRDYFNVSVLFPLSEESGIASVNSWRDTKFGITLGKREGRITADDGSIFTYAGDHSALIDEHNAGQSLVIALANTEEYDGVASMWGNGAATAICTKSTSAYPHDARGVIQHEAGGHGFGKLGDEYIKHRAFIQDCKCSDGCSHVEELLGNKAMGWYRNLSLNGRYSNHEWRQLMFHPNYSDYVDLYEGGYFHSYGVYRSEANSCMNNNVPYFSAVSRMAIVERIKEYAGEEFDFEEFVRKDSREMGRDFTRSGNMPAYPYNMDAPARPTAAPVMMKGSPFDYKNK